MRIIQVLGSSAGGRGQYVAALSREMSALGHQICVVAPRATLERFDFPKTLAMGNRRLGFSRRFLRLCRGADVIHAHGYQAALLVAGCFELFWRKHRQHPVFAITWHNDFLTHGWRRRLDLALAGFPLGFATLVSAVSNQLCDQARELGCAEVFWSPAPSLKVPQLLAQPPVATESKLELRRALFADAPGFDVNLPLVISAARWSEQKDLETSGAAFVALHTPVNWVVLGDGNPEYARRAGLVAAGRRVQRGEQFLLPGAVANMEDYLRAADVFVLTSKSEGWPLSVQEAMAAGLPVVSTPVGGVPEILGGCGFLVPVGDAAGFAAYIESALGDAGKRQGSASRQRAAGFETFATLAQYWLRRYTAPHHAVEHTI